MHDKISIDPEETLGMTALKIMANCAIAQVTKLGAGGAPTPKFHADRWKIAIETPRGVIGLWSCWLGNQFHLGYPGHDERPTGELSTSELVDTMIIRHLGVKLAKPVLQVDATAVQANYEGEYKDKDKPLEEEAMGQIIAYKTRGPRLWAPYYGARVDPDPGRVWVEHSDFSSIATDFRVITPGSPDGFSTVRYGHDDGRTIRTLSFTFANRYAPDGPTAKSDHVQPYRDGFLALACNLARSYGGARAINIDYGCVLTPAQLEALGYANITWIKGSPCTYEGWGNEVVIASKRLTERHAEHVLLMSGNQLVPWATIRRISTDGDLTVSSILDLLTL